MGLLVPPKVRLSWSATSLGSDFLAYRVWRRPARLPVQQWELLATIDVPTGYSAADVEAQCTKFDDYEAGWLNSFVADGQWLDGWDYAVSVVSSGKNLESPLSTDLRNTVTGDDHPWLTFNAAPFLNVPVGRMPKAEGSDDDPMRTYITAGRDKVVTRTALELPARRFDLGWRATGLVGEDQLRGWRAAAASGLVGALLLPLGDRVIGAPSVIEKASQNEDLMLDAEMRVIETSRTSAPAWYNLPCGLVLDGSADYVEHSDVADLDPSGDFTVFCLAAFTTPSGAVNSAFVKGDTSSEQGWRLYSSTTGTSFRFGLNDGSQTVLSSTDSRWFDGTARLAVGVKQSASQALYLDSESVATATATIGAIANARAARVGSASASVADLQAGTFHAWGFYNRALSATEIANLYHYLNGHAGYRPPAGAALFVDARDDRTWSGVGAVMHDLAGSGIYGTIVSAPPVRGVPWALSLLEKF